MKKALFCLLLLTAGTATVQSFAWFGWGLGGRCCGYNGCYRNCCYRGYRNRCYDRCCYRNNCDWCGWRGYRGGCCW